MKKNVNTTVSISLMVTGFVGIDVDGSDVMVTGVSETRMHQRAHTVGNTPVDPEDHDEVAAYAALKVLNDMLAAQKKLIQDKYAETFAELPSSPPMGARS